MATQALAKHEEGGNDVVKLANQLVLRADEFRKALPSHISPERFQRTILTAVQSDPELLLADRQSLVLACMKAAQDGLLPDKREAALVIFTENKKIGSEWVRTKKVQYMPMVYGLRKKVLQSGEITDITANVVYRREAEEGFFVYEEGTEAMLRHKPMLELTEAEATDDCIVAAYSMATFKDGTKSYEVMRRFEITKVQNVSQTGALIDYKGQAREPKGPWKEWYPEQAKKTVIRRHTKTLPMSGDLLIDIEAMDDRQAAQSTVDLLGRVVADEPEITPEPPRRLKAVDNEDPPHDPETGEIEDDETIARQLDQESMASMEGRTEDGDDDVHPARIKASALIAAFDKVEMQREFEAIKSEYFKHADKMPDEIFVETKAAYDAAAKRFASAKAGAK